MQQPPPPPPRSRRGDEGDGNALAAWAIVAAAALTMIAALIIGLSFDIGPSDGSVDLKFKLKIIALSGQFGGFTTATIGGALVIGVALLVAISLARGSSAQSSIATSAAVIAGLLATLTVVSLIIDFTFFSDLDDGSNALTIVGIILADLATLGVLGAAMALGLRAARD